MTGKSPGRQPAITAVGSERWQRVLEEAGSLEFRTAADRAMEISSELTETASAYRL